MTACAEAVADYAGSLASYQDAQTGTSQKGLGDALPKQRTPQTSRERLSQILPASVPTSGQPLTVNALQLVVRISLQTVKR